MTIFYTADVFCDDCGLWTPGVTAIKPPGKIEAFNERENKGYVRHHGGKHKCAECHRAWLDSITVVVGQRAEGDAS